MTAATAEKLRDASGRLFKAIVIIAAILIVTGTIAVLTIWVTSQPTESEDTELANSDLPGIDSQNDELEEFDAAQQSTDLLSATATTDGLPDAAVEPATDPASQNTNDSEAGSPNAPITKGRCSTEVNGKSYADGACYIRLQANGSFQTLSVDDNIFAQLEVIDGEATAYWNETPETTDAPAPLGIMTKAGACWQNADAKICAWAS